MPVPMEEACHNSVFIMTLNNLPVANVLSINKLKTFLNLLYNDSYKPF